MARFLDIIGKNYEMLKATLGKYKNFNEDVFHNTILKCAEAISDVDLKFNSQNDAIRYFIGAYKTNLLRETMYYHNKNVIHPEQLDDKQICYNKSEQAIDINTILTDISEKFGLELSDIYMAHLTDKVSIAELQDISEIKNLKQKLKNVREYVRQKYREIFD